MWVLVLVLAAKTLADHYEPTWASLDTRPLPQWYDDAKFGIFLHWGLYSVPSFGDEWFWQYWKGDKRVEYVDFMKKNYRPGFTYADFAPQFTAEFFDPDQWSELFEAAGARYVVLTTKHHEGFTLWPSKYSWNWNSVDTGPRRDLVQNLAAAIRKRKGIHFGVYHSMFEWFNPLWLKDKAVNFTERNFPTMKTIPELYELVNNYHPEVIWSDGSVWANSDYWGSREFLAWLYNRSPVRHTVVVNDRWGKDAGCKHGDFYTCQDRYNPGHLLAHKWENCMTVDRKSWGYRREATLADILSTHEILTQLIETVSCGGNLLLNVGPTHDGRIVPIFEERLREIGAWLAVNGGAIFGSRPWKHQNDSLTAGVWYTQRKDKVYAALVNLPRGTDQSLTLGSVVLGKQSKVVILGLNQTLSWKNYNSHVVVKLPNRCNVQSVWALEITKCLPRPTKTFQRNVSGLPEL